MNDACYICSGTAQTRCIIGVRRTRQDIPLCLQCKRLVKKRPRARRRKTSHRTRSAPSTRGWIDALRRSWNLSGDCFRCEVSGLRLEMDDPYHPLSITCDHDPPGSASFFIVAWVINDMKSDHNRDEFRRNVSALASIFKTPLENYTQIDRERENFANISGWRRR